MIKEYKRRHKFESSVENKIIVYFNHLRIRSAYIP